jgi:hypothetical protein
MHRAMASGSPGQLGMLPWLVHPHAAQAGLLGALHVERRSSPT